jgi:hypothetical protein
MSPRGTIVAAFLLLACSDDEPAQLTPGEDLTGNWLGCATKGCEEHTLAGLRFEPDGRVRVIHALLCPERGPCPDSVSISVHGGGVARLFRCLTNLPFGYDAAHWQWEGDYVLFRTFYADWQLRTEFGWLQVPLRPRHGGPPFFGVLEYPDADWMERSGGELRECPAL